MEHLRQEVFKLKNDLKTKDREIENFEIELWDILEEDLIGANLNKKQIRESKSYSIESLITVIEEIKRFKSEQVVKAEESFQGQISKKNKEISHLTKALEEAQTQEDLDSTLNSDLENRLKQSEKSNEKLKDALQKSTYALTQYEADTVQQKHALNDVVREDNRTKQLFSELNRELRAKNRYIAKLESDDSAEKRLARFKEQYLILEKKLEALREQEEITHERIKELQEISNTKSHDLSLSLTELETQILAEMAEIKTAALIKEVNQGIPTFSGSKVKGIRDEIDMFIDCCMTVCDDYKADKAIMQKISRLIRNRFTGEAHVVMKDEIFNSLDELKIKMFELFSQPQLLEDNVISMENANKDHRIQSKILEGN